MQWLGCQTEERLAAIEKRSLLEIDHERQITLKVQRELQQLREKNLQSEERQRIELAACKTELAEAKQQLGIAEGKQVELKAVIDQQIGELSTLRQAQARLETQLALAQREVELAQTAAKRFGTQRSMDMGIKLEKIAVLLTIPVRRHDWELLPETIKGSIFLLSLVLCASMMPVEQLPPASWQSAFVLGFVSAVFDNIPLTALALRQGGFDWGFLAFAVGLHPPAC